MRNQALISGLLLVALLLAASVPACKSGPGTPATGGGGSEEFFPDSTVAGDRLFSDRIEVVEVTQPAAAGEEGVFKIRNLTPEDIEYLTGTILFFCDPELPGGIEKIDSEGHLQGFDLFRQETVELRAEYKKPRELRRMKLLIERRPTEPGVNFLGGKVVCTDVQDNLPTKTPGIAFKVQNSSGVILEDVKFRVVLLDRVTGAIVNQSRWTSVEGEILGPGEAKTLVPEFRDDVTGYPIAILQIKQAG